MSAWLLFAEFRAEESLGDGFAGRLRRGGWCARRCQRAERSSFHLIYALKASLHVSGAPFRRAESHFSIVAPGELDERCFH